MWLIAQLRQSTASRAKSAAVIASSALLLCSSAVARDLWLTGWSDDSAYFIDADTRQTVSKGVYEFWEDRYGVSPADIVYLDGRILARIDCGARKHAMVSGIFYLPNGDVDDSGDPPTLVWNRIAPGTIGESLLDFACAKPNDRSKFGIRIHERDAEAWAVKVISDARAQK